MKWSGGSHFRIPHAVPTNCDNCMHLSIPRDDAPFRCKTDKCGWRMALRGWHEEGCPQHEEHDDEDVR